MTKFIIKKTRRGSFYYSLDVDAIEECETCHCLYDDVSTSFEVMIPHEVNIEDAQKVRKEIEKAYKDVCEKRRQEKLLKSLEGRVL
jgi:dihydroxyacetone kinase-like predicted kinase